MEKKLFLSLQTRSTSTKKPIYKILVDGREISVKKITALDQFRELHDFSESIQAVKVLEIKLLNKEHNDTKLDSNNQIVEDLLMIIEKFSIDHINLIDKIDKISVYKDEHGKIHKTYNYITFNGVFTIKIHRNLLYTEWLSSYCR